jgi:transcriptional regulator with XRE-family HTH domain
MYGDKIKAYRIMKGFTQEYMAGELHVAQNTYSKYENNAEKLPLDVLEKIAGVLGISVSDITNNEPIIINNHASNQGAQGRIDNFYADQKELYTKLIDAKDREIERLTKQVEMLMALFGKKD